MWTINAFDGPPSKSAAFNGWRENEAQGVGRLVNTLAPQGQRPEQVERSKSTIIVA